MRKFVHLHVHTEYSMLDGFTRIDRLFSRCKELNMPAVAMTDHGNMFGALHFNKAAIKASTTDPEVNYYDFAKSGEKLSVKPIFGCEFYTVPDMSAKTTVNNIKPKYNHLVLLAKDMTGYKNLIKLVSKSYIDGFYYKPRIDNNLLVNHSDGLVCLSGCLSGAIPHALLNGNRQEAVEHLKFFKELFKEDFYIELQDHNIPRQRMILSQLIDLARAHSVNVVATNDAHYLKKEDAEVQKVLQCINFRTTIDQTLGNDEEEYFPTTEFYLKSGDEMHSLFGNIEGALSNSLVIADKCNVSILKKSNLFPAYIHDKKEIPYTEGDNFELLQRLTYEGLERNYKEVTDKIKQRADSELKVISDSKFVDYFLIVWDFIRHAEEVGIPVGPGRGSGVGSIVAYALGITKIDPLKYDLYFERFLNPERVSAPDFDIDFCVDRRDEIISFVTQKYNEIKKHQELGTEPPMRVAKIVTFGTLAPKNAIKDVGRVYNFPFSEVNKITKAMPGLIKNPLSQLVGIEKGKKGEDNSLPELKDLYENNQQIRKIIEMAMKIEGMPRQVGIHAAGVVICRDEISDHIPMARSSKGKKKRAQDIVSEGEITTEFNMTEIEELGLLKMDFLGLRTLTDIKKAVDMVKVNHGVDIDFYKMGTGDANVYKMIGEGDTHGVFQFESAGMKRFMTALKPESIEDIIAGVALYRPGPMDSIDDYVANKRNPSRVVYSCKQLESILNVTYGIIVYQEQVMRIVQDMAGYSLARADNVRRMMSKKKHDQMEREKKFFIEGCSKNGIASVVAVEVFEKMISFASYAFNKSHAAAYAYIAYQTAYLKCYYPCEYFAAVINNRITDIKELSKYLIFLKQRNIVVLSPDVNASEVFCTVENGAIRIGLGAIKNVGLDILEGVVNERKQNGKFNDFFDFIQRLTGAGALKKKLVESFIFAGAFDSFKYNRSQLMNVYEDAMDRAKKDSEAKAKGQFSMFDMFDIPTQSLQMPKIEEYDAKYKFGKEKEMLGIYVSGSPLDEYRDRLLQYEYNSTDFMSEEDGDSEEDKLEDTAALRDDMSISLGGMLTDPERAYSKKGKLFGTAKLEDLYGTVNIMIAGDKLEKYRLAWEEGKMVTISGRVALKEGDTPSVWVSSIEIWGAQAAKKPAADIKKICLVFDIEFEGEAFFDRIFEVLDAYSGDDEIYIKDSVSGKVKKMPETTRVCQSLLSELSGFLSKESILVK